MTRSRIAEATFSGHHIPARVHRDSLQKLDEGQTQFVQANALIDTGATHIFIDPSVAAALNLKQVNQGEIQTVGRPVGCSIYSGILEIEELGYKERHDMWAPKVNRMNYSIVLGRDVLKNFVISFDGPKDCMMVSYMELVEIPGEHDAS